MAIGVNGDRSFADHVYARFAGKWPRHSVLRHIVLFITVQYNNFIDMQKRAE